MLARSAALAGLVLLVSAAPALAGGRSILRSKRVPEGDTSFTVRCAKGYTALNGAAYPTPDGVIVSRSAPGRGKRDWRFSVSSDQAAKVRTVLRCGRTRFRRAKVRFRLGTQTANDISLEEGETRRIRLRCSKGLVPTGYGQDQRPAEGRDPGAIDLYSVIFRRHGIDFELENDTPGAERVTLYLRCFERTGRRARVHRRSFRNTLAADRTTRVKHRCHRGELSLATGWSVPLHGPVAVTASYPSLRRRGRWTFDNVAEVQRVRTSLLCLAG